MTLRTALVSSIGSSTTRCESPPRLQGARSWARPGTPSDRSDHPVDDDLGEYLVLDTVRADQPTAGFLDGEAVALFDDVAPVRRSIGARNAVFAYRPGSGCLACLESVLQRSSLRVGVTERELLRARGKNIYGLSEDDLKDSPGLNVDISFITCFHTRFVLDVLASAASERPAAVSPAN